MFHINKFTRVGLGTWNMEASPAESIQALQAGLLKGANHIDTAEMYGDGKVEEIVGRAIQGKRDKLFLVSKVLPQNSGYESTLRACERSLKRLQTDYLDVYLLHWREKRTPLAETFRAFEKLKSDGKIRSWGVSNFDVADMEEAMSVAGAPSEKDGRLVCNQVYYSIRERSVEHKLIPWCHKNGVAFVAYSPLGQGRLASHPVLTTMANKKNVTNAQLVLAFLMKQNVFVIPKSSSVKHTQENGEAMKIELSETEWKAMDKVFPMRVKQNLPMI